MRHVEMTIAHLMTREPVSLTRRATVGRALAEMEVAGIRHLPIVDRDRRLVGVVSQRDLLAAASAGDSARPLAGVMRPDVVSVTPETSAHEAAYLILHHGIGCIPVADRSGRLVGIATDADFVRVAYVALGGRVPVEQVELEEKEAAAV
ncbi:MAG TPA: CBS domain-containing protein [Kofleriaceae bacterium]|nr:CBS domain-containing protein [Kofleriaceae bacterium]